MDCVSPWLPKGPRPRASSGYGCDKIQGYLISQPVTPDEFSAMLRQDENLLAVSAGEEALIR